MTMEMASLKVTTEGDSSSYVQSMQGVVDVNAAAVASDKTVIESQGKVAAAFEQTDRKLGTSITGLERFIRGNDDVYRSQAKVAEGTRLLQRAADLYVTTQGRSGISAAEQAKQLDLLHARYAGGAVASGAATAAIGTMATAARSTGQDIEALGGSHLRLTGNIRETKEGIRLFQDALTSGLPIGEAARFGIVALGREYGVLNMLFSPVGLGLAAVGGAMYFVMQRAETLESENRSLAVSLEGLGKTGQASVAGLRAASDELIRFGLSRGDAQAAILSIVRAGPLVPTGLAERIGEAGANQSAVRGTSVQTETTALTTAIEGGAAGLEKYLIARNAGTAADLAAMRAQERLGNQLGVTKIALDALDIASGGKYQESLGTWQKFWHNMEESINSFMNTLAKATDAIADSAKANLSANSSQFSVEPFSGVVIGPDTLAVPPPPETAMHRWQRLRGTLPVSGSYGGEASGAIPTTPSGYASNFNIKSGVVMSGMAGEFADMLSHAAETLPPGYGIVLTSAGRPLGSTSSVGMGSAHVPGLAADFQITGPNGERYPNTGTDTTGLYGRAFGAAQSYAQWAYPGMASYLRTGATFGANGGPISAGSPADIGHLDVRGLPGSTLGGANAVNVATEGYARQIPILKALGIEAEAAKASAEAFDTTLKETHDATAAASAGQAAYSFTMQKAGIEFDKATVAANLNRDATLDVARAYTESEGAGLRAAAATSASIAVYEKYGTVVGHTAEVQELQRRSLEASAAEAISASAKALPGLIEQVAANENLATAAAQGTAAEHEAGLQNEVAAKTHDLLARAKNAGIDVSQGLVKTLHDETDALVHQNDAALQRKAIENSITQRGNQIEVSQLEVSLQGQSGEEIARQVSLLQEKHSLIARGVPLTDQIAKNDLASVDALGRQNIALAEAVRQQQRLDSAITSVASTVENTLTKSISDAFDGTKVETWGTRIKTLLGSIMSQITSFTFIKPLTGTVLGMLGFAGAAQSFGSFDSLLGTAASTSTTAAGTSAGGTGNGTLSTVSSAASIANSSSGLFGSLGGIKTAINDFGSSLGFASTSATDLAAAENVAGFSASGLGQGLFGLTTATGALTAVGAGFGAGTLLNSLLGGNTLTGTIGSGIGSAIGAGIGSFFGPAGTLIGGLFGGASGGIRGNLFGKAATA